jgi:hypothetical protein
MDVEEIGFSAMDWIDLAQDRDHWKTILNTVTNLQVL